MDTGDGYCEQMPFDAIPQIPLLTTPRDSFDYNMAHKKRGICLILDHESFSRKSPITRTLPKRDGTEVDVENLKRTFGDLLGFEVQYHKDLRVSGVLSALKQTANYDHTDHDCFVCFVLTHGDHGELYAYDGKYSLEHLYRYFLNDTCSTLVGKPKLFFVQACQGNRLDNGVIVRSRDAHDGVSANEFFKIPTHADFLCAYSSVPGFYSFRNTMKGSWFIRALTGVFDDYHQQLDVLSMMTIVCQRVAYDYNSHSHCNTMSQKKQVPCITTMLTRRIFLTPKAVDI